jgi:hypothetical protein
VYENKNKVNAALIKDIIAKGAMHTQSQAQILLISKISPNKLIEGGAAILQILIRNHHRAIAGIICSNPLVTTMFRDPIRSYAMLVKPNIAEEHNP